jgi:hypothetical protein
VKHSTAHYMSSHRSTAQHSKGLKAGMDLYVFFGGGGCTVQWGGMPNSKAMSSRVRCMVPTWGLKAGMDLCVGWGLRVGGGGGWGGGAVRG